MRPTTHPCSSDRPPGPERLALYAWITLGASFLTTALVFGVWFSFAVFFATMVEEFQWSRGGAAVAFSVGNLVQAALSPLIGLLTDRWGPRQIVVWGCVISAVSLAACSTVQALWHLTVFFGISIGHGIGGALGPWMGGVVYDHFGHYRLAFVFALLALYGAMAGFWLATRPLATTGGPAPGAAHG